MVQTCIRFNIQVDVDMSVSRKALGAPFSRALELILKAISGWTWIL